MMIRKNWVSGCIRGVNVIAIHQKMLEYQVADVLLGTRDRLVDS